jgi:ParB family transcriptional regulator, chromosome partitioning protein
MPLAGGVEPTFRREPNMSDIDTGATGPTALLPSRYTIEDVDPAATVVSLHNPRHDVEHHDAAFRELVASIRAHGQTDDVLATRRRDGTLVLLTGCRRRQACIEVGALLRVKIYADVTPQFAFMVAHEDERGRAPVSLWDRGRSYQHAINKNVYKDETELAVALGIDKSTVNRAVRFAAAPAEITDLLDVRAVSATQWYAFCPVLEDEATRELVLAEASLVAKSTLKTPAALFSELMKAVAPEVDAGVQDIFDAQSRRIGRIKATRGGGFTVRVMAMDKADAKERASRVRLIAAALGAATAPPLAKPKNETALPLTSVGA